MRCPAEAWTQTGPTPLAVDTAFGPLAYARADRPDTRCLAHPRAPHGPQALPGPGDAWRAPGGYGIAPASPAAAGWPGSRSAAASGSRAAGHAASAAAGILRPRASGCAGGGHVDNPCSERSPGRRPGRRAGDWRWPRDAYNGPNTARHAGGPGGALSHRPPTPGHATRRGDAARVWARQAPDSAPSRSGGPGHRGAPAPRGTGA